VIDRAECEQKGKCVYAESFIKLELGLPLDILSKNGMLGNLGMWIDLSDW